MDDIERLAQFIMEEINGEPSQSEGAVDTAIRLLRWAYRPTEADAVEIVTDEGVVPLRVIRDIPAGDLREVSINTEASVFPDVEPPHVVPSPDISEFMDPVVPKLHPAKRMSLVFVFNTEEELDHVVHQMRQSIRDDSEIEMIAVLGEKTAEILALFGEEDNVEPTATADSEEVGEEGEVRPIDPRL